jgi:stress response protein YsnF
VFRDRLIVIAMTPTSHFSNDPAATHPSPVDSTADGAPPAEVGMPPAGSGVVDAAGQFGTVVSHHALVGAGGGLSDMVVVRHREHQVLLPSALFVPVSATSFRIPLSFAALMSSTGQGGDIVIPVLQEEMTVGTRLVDTGRGVRVHKHVVETPHVIEQALLQDALAIEHVAIGRLLADDELPQVRQEGDVLIVPVIEEVLVLQTRRSLKEEVRIVRSSRLVQQQQTVLLKSEQVVVERFDDATDAHGAAQVGTQAAPDSHTNAYGNPHIMVGTAADQHVGTAVDQRVGSSTDANPSTSPAPGHSGAPGQPGSPGAIQRDVSAGTRLST